MLYYNIYNILQQGSKIMTTITVEKIIETAERLKNEGKNPTQVTVREALGGGSFATIGPVLKSWKDGLKEDHALAEIQVPAAITERLEQLQGAVWQSAVDEAERRLTAEREALKTAQEAAAAEVAEQLESVAMLEIEAEQLRQTIDRLMSETEDQASTVQRLETELSDVKTDAEKRIHAEHEVASKEGWRANAAIERAERAEAQLAAVQQEAKADREAAAKQTRADLTEQKKVHDAEIKKLNSEIEKARSAATESTKKAEKLEREAQGFAAEKQTHQTRLEAAKREAEQTQKRVATLEEKAYKAIQEAAELRGELKAVKVAANKKPTS
jgi:chromosome segregation ATPase